MMDLSRYSDEELEQISQGTYKRPLSDYSEEELEQIVGGTYRAPVKKKPSLISRGLDAVAGAGKAIARGGHIPGDIPLDIGLETGDKVSPMGLSDLITGTPPGKPAEEPTFDVSPPQGMDAFNQEMRMQLYINQKAEGTPDHELRAQLAKEGWSDNIPTKAFPEEKPMGLPSFEMPQLGTGGVAEALVEPGQPSPPSPPAESPIGDVPMGPAFPSPGVTPKPIDWKGFGKEAFLEPALDVEIGYRKWAEGMYNTVANIPGLLDKAADKIAEKTGMPKGGAFKEAEKFLREASVNIAPDAEVVKDRNSLVSKLNQALGQTPGTILEYAAPSKYLGNVAGMAFVDALREADKGAVDVAVGAIRGATLGRILEGTHSLTRPTRAAALATAFGVPTAVSTGDVKETAVSALTGAGLGMMGKPGRDRPGDVIRGALEPLARANVRKKIEYISTRETLRKWQERVKAEKEAKVKAEKEAAAPTPEPTPTPAPKPKPKPPKEAPTAPPPEPKPKPPKEPTPTGWLGDLEKDDRERTYVDMRDLDKRAQSHFDKATELSPKAGEVAYGAAHFDEFIQGAALQEFLFGIQRGSSPLKAANDAKNAVAEWVGKHNKKRKDVNWQRNPTTADTLIEDARRRLQGTAEAQPERREGPRKERSEWPEEKVPDLVTLESDLEVARESLKYRQKDLSDAISKRLGTRDLMSYQDSVERAKESVDALLKRKTELEAEAAPEALPPAEAPEQTPVSEVVDEGVKGAKLEGIPIPKMKKYLLDKLDDAIKEQKAGISEGETVEIVIPGDGDFTVQNNPEALKWFRDRVQKKFPTKETGPPKPTGEKYPPVSKGGKRPTGAIGAVTVAGPYVSDGHFALLAKKSQLKIRPSQRDVDAMEGRELTEKAVKEAIPKLKDLVPTSKTEFLYSESGDVEALGIADFPIAVTEKGAKNVVRLISQKGTETYIDQKYHTAITEAYPDAEFHVNKADPETGVVGVVRKGDVIGAVMPIKVGEIFKEVREGKFPSTEEAPPTEKPESDKVVEGEEEVLEARGPGFKPEPGYKRTVEDVRETETPTAEIIDYEAPMKRSDIIKLFEDKFDIPIKTGGYRFGKTTAGIYKTRGEIIRNKLANDISTAAHEVGHALNKFLWPTKRKGLSVKELKPFEAELRPIATSGHPLKEGLAEFISKYVVNEAEARRVAPTFYSFFEAELDTRAPEVREVLLDARAMYKIYSDQGPEAHFASMIDYGKSRNKGGSFQRFYTAMIHDLYPLELIVREMAEGKELPPDMDPHLLARMMAGNEGRADVFINNRPFKFGTFQFYGKGLRQILDPVKNETKLLEFYMMAVRDRELKRRGIETGFDSGESSKIIEKYRDKFEKTRQELLRFQSHTLRYMLEAGVINFRDYIKMRKANRDYTPFHRVADYMNRKGSKGKGFEVKGKPLQRIRGGTGDYVPPLESIIKNTHLFINAAEKNAVGRALLKLSRSKHGMGKFMDEIPADRRVAAVMGEKELKRTLAMYGKWFESVEGQTVTRTIREAIRDEVGGAELPRDQRLLTERAMEALTSRGYSPAEATQILDRIKGAPEGEARNRVIEREVTQTIVQSTVRTFGIEMPEGVHLLWRDSPFKPSGNVISVMERGEAKFYEVHPDIYKTFMALDKESTSTLMRIIGAPTRLLRAGATLSFEFMARNPVRDQITAYVFSKYGYKPGIDFFKGISSVWRGDKYYQMWKASGGEQAAFVSMDRTARQQTVEDVLRTVDLKGIAKYVVKHPIDALRALSELGEEGTRLGEFRRGIKVEGETRAGILKAGLASREVTLDFRRIGLQGRSVNQLIAFWNANVQGLDKTMRELKNEPKKVLPRLFAGITLPSILLAIANQDNKKIRRLAAWEKWVFHHIDVGPFILRIPKPPLLGTIFGTIPQTMIWAAMDSGEVDYEEMITEIWKAMSPGVMPTPMNPFVENFANLSTFTDRPLISKSKEGMLNPYQYAPYTTEIAKRLAKLMWKIPVVGDTMLANPVKIENIIRGWTGGLGMTLLQTANESLKASGITPPSAPEPSRTWSDIPLIRGFVSRYPSFGMEPINKFYRDYETATEYKATVKMLMREGRRREAKSLYQKNFPLMVKSEKIKKAVSQAGKYVRLVYANPNLDPGEKRRIIDRTLIQMAIMAEDGNRALAEMRKRLKGRKK